jgi:hypothetical protein
MTTKNASVGTTWIKDPTYLQYCTRTDIPFCRCSKDQSISLDVHIGMSIRHEKYWRCITGSLTLVLLVGDTVSIVLPKFNFSKKSLRMRTLMNLGNRVGTILLQDDSITAGGEDKEIRYHIHKRKLYDKKE